MALTTQQFDTLRKPLNPIRVAKRNQGGKQLSYLESWDVRAHLIRMFGYTGWDSEVIRYEHVADREYTSQGDHPKQMIEVIWSAQVRLTIRDEDGYILCTYVEAAVGSASGPVSMLGEHHDNAVKTAASDALKRCAINLGSQFGLSLYDDGSTRDVVKDTLIRPPGYVRRVAEITDEQAEQLKHSLGAQVIEEEPRVPVEEPPVAPPLDGSRA